MHLVTYGITGVHHFVENLYYICIRKIKVLRNNIKNDTVYYYIDLFISSIFQIVIPIMKYHGSLGVQSIEKSNIPAN